MPQLDINTFLSQYFSLISLFIISYVLLAYLVLPLTLRSNVLRNNFLVKFSEINKISFLNINFIYFNLKLVVDFLSSLRLLKFWQDRGNNDINLSKLFFLSNKKNSVLCLNYFNFLNILYI